MYTKEKNVLVYLPCRISYHTWTDPTKTQTTIGSYDKKKMKEAYKRRRSCNEFTEVVYYER